MSVALALLSSLGFGLQTLFVRRGLSRDDESTPLAAATVTLVTSCTLLAAILFVRRGVPALPALAFLLPFLVAGVLDPGVSRLLYFEGIDRVGPSVAAALTAGSPAVATFVAVPLLGERLTPAKALGVGLVVLGVATIQFRRPAADESSVAGELDAIRQELLDTSPRDLSVPAGAAVVIALSFVVVKIGLAGPVGTLVGTTVAQLAAVATILPLALGSGRVRRYAGTASAGASASFVAAGLFVGTAWYAMFLALDLGSVVTVLPVVSTYPLVVVAASYALAREWPRSPALLAAVCAIVVGAAAVQVG
jgi:drug/metabolite transporter (DMT)-like permease